MNTNLFKLGRCKLPMPIRDRIHCHECEREETILVIIMLRANQTSDSLAPHCHSFGLCQPQQVILKTYLQYFGVNRVAKSLQQILIYSNKLDFIHRQYLYFNKSFCIPPHFAYLNKLVCFRLQCRFLKYHWTVWCRQRHVVCVLFNEQHNV